MQENDGLLFESQELIWMKQITRCNSCCRCCGLCRSFSRRRRSCRRTCRSVQVNADRESRVGDGVVAGEQDLEGVSQSLCGDRVSSRHRIDRAESEDWSRVVECELNEVVGTLDVQVGDPDEELNVGRNKCAVGAPVNFYQT